MGWIISLQKEFATPSIDTLQTQNPSTTHYCSTLLHYVFGGGNSKNPCYFSRFNPYAHPTPSLPPITLPLTHPGTRLPPSNPLTLACSPQELLCLQGGHQLVQLGSSPQRPPCQERVAARTLQCDSRFPVRHRGSLGVCPARKELL